ncbi:hypothetical protein SAMN04487761_10296 [Lachnospiraceae bacterium C7]|nr:hypothetical protein SAMN04487761_10296 [Lachnospiraceae bacterium C7]
MKSRITVNYKKIIFLILVVLSAFRVLINLRISYCINQQLMDDDGLMYLYADTLGHLKYLGVYTSRTLIKGISYPLFLAMCNRLWVPYSIAISICDILAAYIFVKAIKPKINNSIILSFIYLLILYNPVNFDAQIRQRMYRNSLIPDFTVLTFAMLIGLFLRRKESLKKQLLWTLGAACSLSFFYYLREDSVWILPFVIVAMLLEILNLFLFDGRENIKAIRWKEILIYAVPVIALFTCTYTLKTLNKYNYGIFVVNDRSDSYFADVMEDLYKIDAKNENEKVWLSRDALKIAFDNSKTLRKIKTEFETNFNYWKINPEAFDGTNVAGDLLSWTFRGAGADHGIYKDAVTANKFWKNVDTELKEAVKKGKIKNKPGIYLSKQARGVQLSEIPKFSLRTLKNLNKASKYEYCSMESQTVSLGNLPDIRRYETEYGVHAQLPFDTPDAQMATSLGATGKANKIIAIYQKASMLVNPIAVLSYIGFTIITIYELFKKKYLNLEMWLMITGIILSAFVLMLGVTFFSCFLSETACLFYGSGSYSLMQLGKYLAIVCFGLYIFETIKKKHNANN